MKIALFGLGRSGLSVYNFLKNRALDEIYLINSGEPQSWACYDLVKAEHTYSDVGDLSFIKALDFIVLSPGIPRTHSALDIAHKNSIPIISEIEFAYLNSDIPIVGITGTNGKTTTTTMIGDILSRLGLKVFVCGNIGRPFSDLLLEQDSYDYAIVELSSFQLESINKFHPLIAVHLNLSANHMERYSSIEDYKVAKDEIFKNQISEDLAITFSKNGPTKAQNIIIKEITGFDLSHSKLVGEHNKTNFFCAYEVAKFISKRNIDKEFQGFINEFTGVEFRLQFLASAHGINFYNDAKSTNSAATIAAVAAFENIENLSLILGGKLRDNSIDIQHEIDFSKLKNVFVFGEARDLLQENINSSNLHTFEKLEDIFDYVKLKKIEGDLVFSPAFPSFDQYKNYEERRRHFTDLVNRFK